MKKILFALLMAAETSLVWGQTITRSLPSSFVPPPPPPNQGSIQTVGSLEFYVFQQNMLAPVSQKRNAEGSEMNKAVNLNVTDQTLRASKDARGSLLPESYESSIRGLQFVKPSPLHSN